MKEENFFLPNNLELEAFDIEINSQFEEIKLSGKTTIEHEKLFGVFCIFKGGNQANYLSSMSISVNSERLISAEPFSPAIIEKTNYLSVLQALWIVDKKISASDVLIKYKDGGETPAPYKLTVYFICEKKN